MSVIERGLVEHQREADVVCEFEVVSTWVALQESLPLQEHGGVVADNHLVLDASAGLDCGVKDARGAWVQGLVDEADSVQGLPLTIGQQVVTRS